MHSGLILPISQTRLNSYGNSDDGLETKLLNYFWNIELSQAFYPLLQTFEVALRNTIHQTLSSHFGGNEWWFDLPDLLGVDQMAKVNAERDNLERKQKPLTSDRLVAELTFGFWTSLLNRPYESTLWHTGRPILLVSAFPNLPRYRQTRKSDYGRAQLANTMRNRIFHYEPIWNRQNLRKDHDNVAEGLGWMSTKMQLASAFFDTFNEIHERGARYNRELLLDHLQGRPKRYV